MFYPCFSLKNVLRENQFVHVREETHLSQDYISSEGRTRRKKTYGGILDVSSLQMLEEKRDIYCLLSYVLHNTKPVGHQVHISKLNLQRMVNTYGFKSSRGLICYRPLYSVVFFCQLQDLVGLLISILLLGDFSLVLLTLLQMFSISLADVFLVLFILPLGILLPFPAGINALFSQGPRRSAGLARIYALWNITSLVNVVSSSHSFTLPDFNPISLVHYS